MRRPNMLLFTPYMVECATSITEHGMVSTVNSNLLAWVRLLNIGEEISAAYLLNHSGSTTEKISDQRILKAITVFDVRLRRWFSNNQGPAMNGSECLANVLLITNTITRCARNGLLLHTYTPAGARRTHALPQRRIQAALRDAETGG